MCALNEQFSFGSGLNVIATNGHRHTKTENDGFFSTKMLKIVYPHTECTSVKNRKRLFGAIVVVEFFFVSKSYKFSKSNFHKLENFIPTNSKQFIN